MCVCVGICILLQVPIEARGIGSPEAGGTLGLGAERRSSAEKDMLLTAEPSLQAQSQLFSAFLHGSQVP